MSVALYPNEPEPIDEGNSPEPQKLDEVMLAMDVVDTLRHEAGLLERDLSAPEREAQLLGRLREIYAGQGIDVPEDILREGVRAMDDHRFAYTPQKPTFFSKAYINRGKWGKPLLVVFGVLGMAWAVNYAAFEAPKNLEVKKQERALTIDLPKSLNEARENGLALARTDEIKTRIHALHADGLAVAKSGDYEAAKGIETTLNQLNTNLRQAYVVRIVSRPRELSAVIRGSDDNANVSNYYLIVEAINADGKTVTLSINSEELQKNTHADIWGVRVPLRVFNAVKEDKLDDQIIQNAIIGRKKRGYLDIDYSVDTSGGLIVEW